MVRNIKKESISSDLIDKVVRSYLSDQYSINKSLNKKEGRYLKLPYVGFFSRRTHNKIKRIVKKLCKD